jgi:hypothetical protein
MTGMTIIVMVVVGITGCPKAVADDHKAEEKQFEGTLRVQITKKWGGPCITPVMPSKVIEDVRQAARGRVRFQGYTEPEDPSRAGASSDKGGKHPRRGERGGEENASFEGQRLR